jgi:ABC-type amino acid transport substrate-binding protein
MTTSSISTFARAAVAAMALASSAFAADLDEIKARGELRHLGVRYGNFVTGAGDGLEVELVQGFAREIGVTYRLVYSDFYNVIRDLLGRDMVRTDDGVSLGGEHPVKGDIIATGFTVLPWRAEVVAFSEPTLPNLVLLVASARSPLQPIRAGETLDDDIAATKAMVGNRSILVMRDTGLDPINYGLANAGTDLRAYTKSTNLNEMVPALVNGEAELTLLDVPDAILDLDRWAGAIKILGPVSGHQSLAAAFPKDAPKLRTAFNAYLRRIKSDGSYDVLVDKYFPGIRHFFPEFFAH